MSEKGKMMVRFPQRVVCMTEESVELLYALGLEDRIIGVSAYVKRPVEAQKKQKISVFTHAQLDKIKELSPDLVLGFSDIQKDIAKDLIGMGLDVYIANHRSLEGVLDYCVRLGALFGESEKAIEYTDGLKRKIDDCQKRNSGAQRPKIYIEEWPDPQIVGINWFSEVIQLCGGIDLFRDKATQSLGSNRIISHDQVIKANPDIMLACWCGKPVNFEEIKNRDGYNALNFIKHEQLHELEPEIFLQPGPAPIVDGIDIIESIFNSWRSVNLN